jgi:hypothetical protein
MSFESLRNNLVIIGQSSIEDARNSLGRYGYSEDDFSISVVDDTQPTAGLFPYRGRVTFKHKPTGKEKTYYAGHESTWAAEFEIDLQHGYFT